MSFITGTFLIDAPSSALNNSGLPIPGSRTDNTSSTKFIRTPGGDTYPYVSAQAFRYWLRDTLEKSKEIRWEPAPIYRESKIAYSDANPIYFWDDDLLGYMRAPSKKGKDFDPVTDIEEKQTVTRASPFRVSTLVSIAPVNLTSDFGTMSRQDGDPVPYEHQFYRTTLVGSLSLDLRQAGTFYYRDRTGYKNLDSVRTAIAAEEGLKHIQEERAYQLDPPARRTERVRSLLYGLGVLQGGAKQATHYTDVMPAFVILALVKNGNNPFSHIFDYDKKQDKPTLKSEVLIRILQDIELQLVDDSPILVGWKHGYLDKERAKLTEVTGIEVVSPRYAFETMADWIVNHPESLDI